MKNSPVGEIQSQSIPHTRKNQKLLLVRLFFTTIIFIQFLGGCSLIKARVYRVGIISGMDAFLTITDGFIGKMTELGYIEGENIEYDYWKLDDDPAEEEKVIKKFIADEVDLMVVFPLRPAKTAKTLTQGTGIPIVFAGASIEGTDLVKSLREPGDNITGVRFPMIELNAKRLELLLEIAPDVKRIMIIYDRNYPSYKPSRQAVDNVAITNDITFIETNVATLDEIKSNLQTFEQQTDIGVDAIFLMPDLLVGSVAAWEIIEPFAMKHNLPVVGTMEYNLEDAGLLLVNSSHYEIGGLAAVISDKILHGTPAGSIPVATPNMNLYINYRRAQELGLTVPEGLLIQAHQVIR